MNKKEDYQKAMEVLPRCLFAGISPMNAEAAMGSLDSIRAYVRELEKDIAIKDNMARWIKLLDQARSYEDYADDARNYGDDRLCEKYKGLAAACRVESDRLKCEVDRLRDGLPVRQSEEGRNG